MTARKKIPHRKPSGKAANKTVPTRASAADFIKSIADPNKRRDCQTLARMMRELVGKQARMWGGSIVGYGQYHYSYDSGREGDMMLTGFSPRAQNLAIYIMPGFASYGALLKKLGKFKTGKSCLYVKQLDDVDQKVLRQLIERSVKDMKKKYDA